MAVAVAVVVSLEVGVTGAVAADFGSTVIVTLIVDFEAVTGAVIGGFVFGS